MLDSIYASRFFVASLVLGFSVNMKIFILFTIYLWVIFSPFANQIRYDLFLGNHGVLCEFHLSLGEEGRFRVHCLPEHKRMGEFLDFQMAFNISKAFSDSICFLTMNCSQGLICFPQGLHQAPGLKCGPQGDHTLHMSQGEELF